MKKIDIDHDLLLVKKMINHQGKSKTLFSILQKVAAILILPLLIYTAYSISGSQGSFRRTVTMKSTETAFGVRSQIELSDGTKVWLNSGSKLTYPEEFTGNSREVKLVGEAYFHVESDKVHPFYVDLNGYKVKATGTRFDISNYPEDREMTTYLEHGKVSVLESGNEKYVNPILLKENEIILVNKSKKQYQIQKGDSKKYIAWINGLLLFKNDNIYDVAERLGRWFNADIIIDKNLAQSGYVFTATFQYESLEEALRLLAYSTPISYKIIQGTKQPDASYSKRKVIISKL